MSKGIVRSIVLLFINAMLSGCGTAAAITPTATVQFDGILPESVLDFHLAEHNSLYGAPRFVLTIYKLPFSHYFQSIQLNKDGAFFGWTQAEIQPPAAVERAASWAGKTTALEWVGLLNTLNSILATWPRDYQTGDYVVALSVLETSGPKIRVCSEVNCPKEMCFIFVIANEVAQTQDPRNSAQLVCPINR